MFEAAKRNLKEPPKEFTDLAIRMAKGSGGFFEGSVATWAGQAAGQDKELLAAFEVANAQRRHGGSTVSQLARSRLEASINGPVRDRQGAFSRQAQGRGAGRDFAG